MCEERELDLNIDGIKKYIKIRYPVLMLDGATVTPGVKAEGYKMLSYNEAFWQGHYPDYPIFPGTYQLEALAQLFSLTFLTQDGNTSVLIPNLVGFDKVRFFKEVHPGVCFKMETELHSLRGNLAKGQAAGFVNGEKVCSAEIKSFIK